MKSSPFYGNRLGVGCQWNCVCCGTSLWLILSAGSALLMGTYMEQGVQCSLDPRKWYLCCPAWWWWDRPFLLAAKNLAHWLILVPTPVWAHDYCSSRGVGNIVWDRPGVDISVHGLVHVWNCRPYLIGLIHRSSGPNRLGNLPRKPAFVNSGPVNMREFGWPVQPTAQCMVVKCMESLFRYPR